jgi:hypothetical protein
MEVDTETGIGEDPQVRVRGRRRHDREPADRRGADATAGSRRASPRPCTRRRVRRRRQPDHRHLRRLPAALGGRPAALRHRPTRARRPGNPIGPRGSGRPAASPSTPRWSTPALGRRPHLGVSDIRMPLPNGPERGLCGAIPGTAGTAGSGPSAEHHSAYAGPSTETTTGSCPPTASSLGRGPMIPAAFASRPGPTDGSDEACRRSPPVVRT